MSENEFFNNVFGRFNGKREIIANNFTHPDMLENGTPVEGWGLIYVCPLGSRSPLKADFLHFRTWPVGHPINNDAAGVTQYDLEYKYEKIVQTFGTHN